MQRAAAMQQVITLFWRSHMQGDLRTHLLEIMECAGVTIQKAMAPATVTHVIAADLADETSQKLSVARQHQCAHCLHFSKTLPYGIPRAAISPFAGSWGNRVDAHASLRMALCWALACMQTTPVQDSAGRCDDLASSSA